MELVKESSARQFVKESSGSEYGRVFTTEGDSEREAEHLSNLAKEWLPTFLINRPLMEALDKLIKDKGIRAVRLAGLVGPCLLPLQFAHWLTCLMQVTFVVLHGNSPCESEGFGPWSICIFLVVLFQRNHTEWRATQHCMIEYLQKHHDAHKVPFGKLLGYPMSATLWFITSVTSSNLALLDMRSDAQFAGVALKMLQCHGRDMQHLWSQVWEQSLLGMVGVPEVTLWTYVLVAFLLSLLQFFVPIFGTTRKKACAEGCSLSFKEGDEYGEEGADHTCSGKSVNNEDMFCVLTDCGDMRTCQKMYKAILEIRIRDAFEAKRLGLGHMIGIYRFTKRQSERVVFTWMFEHILQINTQTVFFSLQRAHANKEFTYRQAVVLVSLALSFVSAFAGIAEVELNRKEEGEWLDFFSDEENAFAADVDEKEKREISYHVDLVSRMRQFERVFEFVLFFTLVYCACRLVGSFVCEEAVWDITGCVHFSE